MDQVLKFYPFTSIFDPGFWSQYANDKLHIHRLDDSEVPLTLSYTHSMHPSVPPRLSAHVEYSFTKHKNIGAGVIAVPSSLTNYNTIDEFKACDKSSIFNDTAKTIWSDMLTLKALDNPSLLLRSCLISFADLKKWTFTYWFAVPAFIPSEISIKTSSFSVLPDERVQNINDLPTARQLSSLLFNHTNSQGTPLALIFDKSSQMILSFKHILTVKLSDVVLVINDATCMDGVTGWNSRNLLLYTYMLLKAQNPDLESNISFPVIFLRDNAFYSVDGSSSLGQGTNIVDSENVVFNNYYTRWSKVTIDLNSTQKDSIDVITEAISYLKTSLETCIDLDSPTLPSKNDETVSATSIPNFPTVTGWERIDNKLKPRVTNLSSLLDKKEIARRGVELNIQLMKWRMLPSLNTDLISKTKCLLIGAGTLGCNVSRLLLAWGHTDITMVDNGKVAHSNPVRQSLYTSEDVGRFKTDAACDMLRKIHPAVEATSVVMNVPMPGHHMGIFPVEVESVDGVKKTPTQLKKEKERHELLQDVVKLANLVKNSDVVFLLTDSRESRWLPALLAMAYGKICINSALGFDSYVTMRHGQRGKTDGSVVGIGECNKNQEKSLNAQNNEASQSCDYHPEIPYQNLSLPPLPVLPLCPDISCYFCIDITAPANSLKQRTLDQQCTVTRPGLAYISSALAVEMEVSVISSELQGRSHAFLDVSERNRIKENNRDVCDWCGETCQTYKDKKNPQITSELEVTDKKHKINCRDDTGGLGCIPHQVRGSFYEQQHYLMKGTNQPSCCCCGESVYKYMVENPLYFIEQSLCIDGYLEEASGLNEMLKAGEEIDWEDDDFDFDMSNDQSDDDF